MSTLYFISANMREQSKIIASLRDNTRILHAIESRLDAIERRFGSDLQWSSAGELSFPSFPIFKTVEEYEDLENHDREVS